MPNAPKKPATPKMSPAAKPKAAEKPAADAFTPEQEAAIATALRQCNSHLTKLDTAVAQAVIARLKAYYVTERGKKAKVKSVSVMWG